MSPSTNTRSGPTASITTLAIFPHTSIYITQSDLDNTDRYVHTDIKSFNDNITSLLTKILDTNDKQDAKLYNQDEKSQSFHPNYHLIKTA